MIMSHFKKTMKSYAERFKSKSRPIRRNRFFWEQILFVTKKAFFGKIKTPLKIHFEGRKA